MNSEGREAEEEERRDQYSGRVGLFVVVIMSVGLFDMSVMVVVVVHALNDGAITRSGVAGVVAVVHGHAVGHVEARMGVAACEVPDASTRVEKAHPAPARVEAA